MAHLSGGASSLEQWLEQGFAALRQRQATNALRLFECALQLQSDEARALVGATSALLQLAQLRAALAVSQRALQLQPSIPEIQVNAAAVLLALKRPAPALACSDAALRLRPSFFEAFYNRAESLLALKRPQEAQAAFDRALSLRPDFAPGWCGRGHACVAIGARQQALESYRRALALDPAFPAARVGSLMAVLPVIPEAGQVEPSRAAFSLELERFEGWVHRQKSINELALVGVSQPFFLAYQPHRNRDLLGRWGQITAGMMERWSARQSWPPLAAPAIPAAEADARIHLGIVTAHVRDHSVFRALISGWLQQLDPGEVRLTVFHLAAVDALPPEVAPPHVELASCADLSLLECAALIRSKRCDALLYPEIGMDPTTVQLASLRLARHQIAAWGHPETTGLPTIDFYLSAAAFEPPDAQENYSERLVVLPNQGCYYEPLALDAPVDLARLGLSADRPLLVSAGTPYKYQPAADAALAGIARALPDCQIVLFQSRPAALSDALLQRLRARFREGGADPACLKLIAWQSPPQFLGLLRRAHLYLDTIGFSGFNTVMQAIECALPVVAYEGDYMRGRFASGLLRSIRLDRWIATSLEQYVQLTVGLIQDTGLRAQVREAMQQSRDALFRDRGTIEALQKFLRSLRNA